MREAASIGTSAISRQWLVFPDYPAPIVRNAGDERELITGILAFNALIDEQMRRTD
jgi:hypothetical protein